MVTVECVILGVCPPYLEIDQLTYSILRRHISSVFCQFSPLLLSYEISLRIPWDTQIETFFRGVRFLPEGRAERSL